MKYVMIYWMVGSILFSGCIPSETNESYVKDHFRQLDKKKQYKAAAFLESYMPLHKSILHHIYDIHGNIVPFSPYNYETLYKGQEVFDSLSKTNAVVRIVEEDTRKISDQYLIRYIDNSVQLWETSPYAQHLDFKEFCEYLLPYRNGNERLSDYFNVVRSKYTFLLDSSKSISPADAAAIINDDLKSNFEFDLRSQGELTEPDMLTILKNKKGSCKSLTQFTAATMRSIGIPVAIDECPVWAHRNGGHQWNAVLDFDNQWIPFGGAETNPDEFDVISDSVKAPKIYRHTFSIQEKYQPEGIAGDNLPPIFRVKNRLDVTDDYVSTSDVNIEISGDSIHSNVIYLAVFNAGIWKIVAWAPLIDKKAIFKDMGNNEIVYLPMIFENNKSRAIGHPFILRKSGKELIVPNIKGRQPFKLQLYNKFFDFKWNIGIPKKDWQMELYYWDNKWISCGVCVVGDDETLHYDQVPENCLYLIKSHDWDNTWQRIFTIADGEQKWY